MALAVNTHKGAILGGELPSTAIWHISHGQHQDKLVFGDSLIQ